MHGNYIDNLTLEDIMKTVKCSNRNQTGLVESIPLHFLIQWAACPPEAGCSWGELATYAADMVKRGQDETPLLVVNPIKNELRLDIGNHRVYFLPLAGIKNIECACLVSSKTILTPGNGKHSYDGGSLIRNNAKSKIGEYCYPSDVLQLP